MADVDAIFVFAKNWRFKFKFLEKKTTFNLKTMNQMLKLSLESTKKSSLAGKIIGKI